MGACMGVSVLETSVVGPFFMKLPVFQSLLVLVVDHICGTCMVGSGYYVL